MRYIDGAEIPIAVFNIVVVMAITVLSSTEFIFAQREKTLHHVFHLFYQVFSVFTIIIFLIGIADILLRFQSMPVGQFTRQVVNSLTHSVSIITSILWVSALSVEVLFNTRQMFRSTLLVLLSLYILFLALHIPAFIDIPEYERVREKNWRDIFPRNIFQLTPPSKRAGNR